MEYEAFREIKKKRNGLGKNKGDEPTGETVSRLMIMIKPIEVRESLK